MGIATGAKLTADNFNNAFVCKNEDDETTGRLKTSKWFTTEKRTEAAAATLNLTVDVGFIEIQGAGATDILSFVSSVPGLEDGQQFALFNNTDSDITVSAITSKTVVIEPQCAMAFTYCGSEFVPFGADSGVNFNALTDIGAAAVDADEMVIYDASADEVKKITVLELKNLISYDPGIYETKQLPANVTTNGLITALGFNNLTIGKTYRIRGMVHMAISTTDGTIRAELVHNGNVLLNTEFNVNPTGSGNLTSADGHFAVDTGFFVAGSTTTTFEALDMSPGDSIEGDGTNAETWLEIYEIEQPPVVTTIF